MNFKEQGNQALANDDIKGAIDFYTKAIDEDNNQSIFYSNRAICYKKLGQIGKAMEDAQCAIEIDEKNIKAQFVMALCQLVKGQRGQDAKMVEKGEKRLRHAHGMCRAQKKDQFEKRIKKFILRARKLKFVIEEKRRLTDLEEFYRVAMEKIGCDPELKESEKKRKRELLDKYIDRDRYSYKIADYFLCELSGELLLDPVITIYGNTYERENLIQYMNQCGKDPKSNKSLALPEVYPNLAMRDAVETFLKQNPWAFEFKSKADLFEYEIDFN